MDARKRVSSMSERDRKAAAKEIAKAKKDAERDMEIVADLAAKAQARNHLPMTSKRDIIAQSLLELTHRTEVQEKKYRDAFSKLLEKYELLHTTLEASLNEIAARDLIKQQELREKEEGLSARLQAIKDNEEWRNRKPNFKAGATQPTDDVFFGYGTLAGVTRTQLKEQEEERRARG
jgi:hypothetical protein